MDLALLQKKVAKNIQEGPGDSLESLEKFLIQWWCRHYNRPYKDPLIQTYTFDELIFEFFDVELRSNPEKLKSALESTGDIPKEEEEDEKWVQEMMGSNYMSKKEQEEKLHKIDELEQNVEPLDEFSTTFDLNE